MCVCGGRGGNGENFDNYLVCKSICTVFMNSTVRMYVC